MLICNKISCRFDFFFFFFFALHCIAINYFFVRRHHSTLCYDTLGYVMFRQHFTPGGRLCLPYLPAYWCLLSPNNKHAPLFEIWHMCFKINVGLLYFCTICIFVTFTYRSALPTKHESFVCHKTSIF